MHGIWIILGAQSSTHLSRWIQEQWFKVVNNCPISNLYLPMVVILPDLYVYIIYGIIFDIVNYLVRGNYEYL